MKADSPAERAGLAASDIIVGLDGMPVTSMGQLVAALRRHDPGDTVRVDVVRDQQPMSMVVMLVERPTPAYGQPMSDVPGGNNPFEGLPMFRDLARLFAGQGPVNWDVARQIAVWMATEGEAEPNVDPVERIRLRGVAAGGRPARHRCDRPVHRPRRRPVARGPDHQGRLGPHSLQAYRPLLERLADAVSAAGASEGTGPDPATQLLGDLGQMVGPVLLGMQSGFMLGHLGRRALGQYDLPLPRGPPTSC